MLFETLLGLLMAILSWFQSRNETLFMWKVLMIQTGIVR